MAAAARVQELEAAVAAKDVQLDTAVQQVSLMQHELEALRQGLSGRQAAALDAARHEFGAALQEVQVELEAVRQQACDHSLAAARQGRALAAILRVLAVHAGEDGASGPGVEGGAADPAMLAAPDPQKAVAFVEAVSGAMLDMQQQWQLEKAELAQVGGGPGLRRHLRVHRLRHAHHCVGVAEAATLHPSAGAGGG